MESITDVYENQWTGSDALHAQAQAVDVLWQDFSHKLADQVLIPLNTYTAQFPEMKVSHFRQLEDDDNLISQLLYSKSNLVCLFHRKRLINVEEN